MSEQEWLDSERPNEMLEFVRPKASKRKLRLFAGACFRRLTWLLPDPRQQKAIEMLENASENTIFPRGVVQRARLALPSSKESFAGKYRDTDDPYYVALMLYREFMSSATGHHATCATAGLADPIDEQREQAHFLRCIFGPMPFRAVSVAPAWRTPSVIALAHEIDQGNCFENLSSLADALGEAGCRDAEILSHCRNPGPHVRGCWVVDLLLGEK